MLLGKRPRPPMKRTTSLKEFTFDLDTSIGDISPSDPPKLKLASFGGSDQRLLTTASPKINRRLSPGFETANFLRSCGFCKRRLVPCRDLYMYRGDTAFCSHECRHEQMIQDERKEKCPVISYKKSSSSSSSSSTASKSTKSGTVTF